MNIVRISGIAAILVAGVHAGDVPEMRAAFDKETGQVSLTESGKPVLQYNYHTVPLPEGVKESKYGKPRSNYLHPLFGPDGQELTYDWSKDHPHHRGIYWAWPEVQFNGELGDLHALQRVWARPTGKIATRRHADWAEVVAESRWMWEDKTPIVREQTTIRAWKDGAEGRWIDLEFRFEALEDGVTLARRGTKAYGGLNIRLAKITGMTLAHHADPEDAQTRMAWQSASGTWSGSGEPLSMVVFEKTSNPGYPADYAEYPDLPWFQPTFPRAGTRHALKKGAPLVLRYRILIRRGPPAGEGTLRAQWTKSQNSDPTQQP